MLSISLRLSADYGVKSIDFTPQSADNLTVFLGMGNFPNNGDFEGLVGKKI